MQSQNKLGSTVNESELIRDLLGKEPSYQKISDCNHGGLKIKRIECLCKCFCMKASANYVHMYTWNSKIWVYLQSWNVTEILLWFFENHSCNWLPNATSRCGPSCWAEYASKWGWSFRGKQLRSSCNYLQCRIQLGKDERRNFRWNVWKFPNPPLSNSYLQERTTEHFFKIDFIWIQILKTCSKKYQKFWISNLSDS